MPCENYDVKTGNSSLLLAKCDRCCKYQRRPNVGAGISARFSKFAFALFCYINKSLNDWPLGEQ